MNYIIPFLIILAFITINLKFNIENFQGGTDLAMAKALLKTSIFNDKKCLSKGELKRKINNQIDKYLNLYLTFSGKNKVCLSDIEGYIN
jgi:hypothetical protein